MWVLDKPKTTHQKKKKKMKKINLQLNYIETQNYKYYLEACTTLLYRKQCVLDWQFSPNHIIEHKIKHICGDNYCYLGCIWFDESWKIFFIFLEFVYQQNLSKN